MDDDVSIESHREVLFITYFESMTLGEERFCMLAESL